MPIGKTWIFPRRFGLFLELSAATPFLEPNQSLPSLARPSSTFDLCAMFCCLGFTCDGGAFGWVRV